ncbi:hypothetical protein DSO57_1037373 [Entomophthora muscae]|uniref:Uncharacterized protein n=1 Tax=Entomophthora muscae TaxID=34485 RepID=A0ACC2S147_9FUNG|nr:hypothetical protein DSO57_1037373 [Entomophthora muscae]
MSNGFLIPTSSDREREILSLRQKLYTRFLMMLWIEMALFLGILVWLIVSQTDLIFYFVLLHMVLLVLGFQLWQFYCSSQALRKVQMIGLQSVSFRQPDLILPRFGVAPPSYLEAFDLREIRSTSVTIPDKCLTTRVNC